MEKAAVYHISEHIFAYATKPDTLAVRLRMKAQDCTGVFIYYKNLYDHTDTFYKKPMQIILQDDLCVLYEAKIQIPQKHFKYYFQIETSDGLFYYTSDGFLDFVSHTHCFYYPAIHEDEIISLPGWAEGSMIYQIMVDRFLNGDPSNDPSCVANVNEKPGRNTFYGGDFQGIIQKLDYIHDLGAEMIYLSPVFASPTYHKYDVKDYYEIEESFGGKEMLAELVHRAHEKGIRIILDAVFNHCSVQNDLFQDVIKNGKNSKFSSWFYIEDFPVDPDRCNYDTFAGAVPEMPRFNTANPEVIQYLTDVALYWTKELCIDGWRLDVADEVSHAFWREFRRKIKSYDEDVLIIGEVWNHAGKWLLGDEFDTVTNYKYRGYLLDFALGKMNADEFWNKNNANKMHYKTPVFNYLVIFPGTHDTIRAATLLGDESIYRLVLAATLSMDGMPLIYYGDEIGLQGGEDPDNRRAMPWDEVDNKVEGIRELAQFRKNSEVLKKGSLERLDCDGRVIAFKRFLGQMSLSVVLNFEPHDVQLSGKYSEILQGKGVITENGLCVGGRDFAIVR